MNMRGIPQYTLVWGACYTLGAGYLSKNTVIWSYNVKSGDIRPCSYPSHLEVM